MLTRDLLVVLTIVIFISATPTITLGASQDTKLIRGRDYVIDADWHQGFMLIRDAYPEAQFFEQTCSLYSTTFLQVFDGGIKARCTYHLVMSEVKARYPTLADVWKGRRIDPPLEHTALSYFRELYNKKYRSCSRVRYYNAGGYYYTNCKNGAWTNLAAIRLAKERARQSKIFWNRVTTIFRYTLVVSIVLTTLYFSRGWLATLAFQLYWTWINRPYWPVWRLRRDVLLGEPFNFERYRDGLDLERCYKSMSPARAKAVAAQVDRLTAALEQARLKRQAQAFR